MKATISDFVSTVITVVYINIYCFLYGFFCLFRREGSVFRISREVNHIFHPRYFVVKNSTPVRPGRTMFFMNHRSYADYFVDCFMTGGSSYLSKMGIIFAFPGPSYCGYLLNFVWFFFKHKNIDRKWFTKFFHKKWKQRPTSGCIVYPEGAISRKGDNTPLKTGVMEVAYNLNCPCQIVLTDGKEDIVNVETLIIQENVHLSVCVSEVLIPHDCKTKEEWFQKVREVWRRTEESLSKKDGEKEIIAPLPGVNTDLCLDEKIQGNAIVFSVSVIIAVAAIVYCILNI